MYILNKIKLLIHSHEKHLKIILLERLMHLNYDHLVTQMLMNNESVGFLLLSYMVLALRKQVSYSLNTFSQIPIQLNSKKIFVQKNIKNLYHKVLKVLHHLLKLINKHKILKSLQTILFKNIKFHFHLMNNSIMQFYIVNGLK